MTDKQELLPLLRTNVDLNFGGDGGVDTRPIVEEFLWGPSFVSYLSDINWDIVIASDCIYSDEKLWRLLGHSLVELSNEYTNVIISYELRSKADAGFFPFIRNFFVVEKVDDNDLDPVFRCDDIGLFRLRKILPPE